MDAILIIDDSQELREKYKKALGKAGFEVLEAANALGVVEILMAKKNDIGVILLDIQIPEIDGREVYDMILEYTNQIPIIVSSVLPVNDQKLKIPRARDYFNKAQGEKVLIEKIQGILARF
jgi:two-component system KDP operon response regulator KdpE